jgi:hypothetical protein
MPESASAKRSTEVIDKLRELAVISAYLALTLLATYPLARLAGSSIPQGDDSWQNYWNLWWAKTALVDRFVNPYVTSDLHYPYGTTLYFHTLNLLGGIFSLPIVVTFGIPAAYNVLVVASFVLSGYGTYRLTRYVLTRQTAPTELGSGVRLAAFFAGAVFAFSSYRYAHVLGHLDLVSTQWLPFSVLFLLKVRDEGGWRNVMIAALFLLATALTSSYYMVFVFIFLSCIVIDLFVGRTKEWSMPMRRIVSTVVVFLILGLPVLLPMLVLGRAEGRVSNVALDVNRFSADALAFVIPSPLSSVWGDIVASIHRVISPNGGVETVVFLGFVPLAVGGIGLKRCPALRRYWLPPLLLFASLALGPVMHVAGQAILPQLAAIMPYSLLASLPYGDIPRVPARYAVMAMLCLSVIAGAGLRTLLRNLKAPTQVAVASLLTALAIGENVIVPLPLMTVDEPPFFNQIRSDATRGGMLELPVQNERQDIPERMFYQTIHEKPIYGGYLSRALPPLSFDAVPGFSQLTTLSDGVDDVVRYDAAGLPGISRAALNFYGAGYVVIEKKFMAPAAFERGREIADRLLGPASRIYHSDQLVGYSVPQAPASAPPAIWLDTGWSYLERLPDHGLDGRTLRWRWMSERARLGVIAAHSTEVRLNFVAQALGRVRRLQFVVNGSEIATVPIGVARSVYETPPFQLPDGVTMIELRSLDGTDSAGPDQRQLSFALYGLELAIADRGESRP